MKTEELTEALRERILKTFMEHARAVGIRAVSTDQMAKLLAISKKTLYKHFASKEAMVGAVLDLWGERVKEPTCLKVGDNPRSVIRQSVTEWYDNDREFCEAFWDEVAEDYPALKAKYFTTMYQRSIKIARQLYQFYKPEIPTGVVREAYMLLLMKASEKYFYLAAEVSRRDAVLSSLDIWIDGCLNLPAVYTQEHVQNEAQVRTAGLT